MTAFIKYSEVGISTKMYVLALTGSASSQRKMSNIYLDSPLNQPGSIVLSVTRLTVEPGVMFEPRHGYITYVEIVHEIISTYGHSPLPMIQEGQLSITGKSICTSTGLPSGLPLRRGTLYIN